MASGFYQTTFIASDRPMVRPSIDREPYGLPGNTGRSTCHQQPKITTTPRGRSGALTWRTRLHWPNSRTMRHRLSRRCRAGHHSLAVVKGLPRLPALGLRSTAFGSGGGVAVTIANWSATACAISCCRDSSTPAVPGIVMPAITPPTRTDATSRLLPSRVCLPQSPARRYALHGRHRTMTQVE